jgi:hypothetical protein
MLFASVLFAPGQRARLGWARRVAAGAGIACTALLVAACNAQGGPSVVVTGAPNPAGASSTSAAVTAKTTPRVYLAEGQDVRGRLLYRPACKSGCPLSGDSTAILNTMTWPTWSASKAVGTGTYELDGCNPDCAAGPIYKVPAVVTLSKPVKVCSSAGTRLGLEQGFVPVPAWPAQGPAGQQRAAEPLGVLVGEIRRPAQLR